jgi:cysteinyl-tRNA synthetase
MIRLTNTRTRRKEPFEPLDPSRVRMYVCGPTVYDRAHLGNARPVVVFDVLFRLLRHVYCEDHVTYVRNFTDVDDKINARAAETGRPIRDITDETIRWYHDDMDALGALRPTQEPRATDWIGAMVVMTQDLIAKGHAYEAAGHVLFRVRTYEAYGQLSGRSLDDMIAGARVEVAPFKEDPLDFVLWKPSDETQPGWDSPWGRGRPGWHIECSAMSRELLGTTFDIHGGGLDLQFPHHENEIAQSACADPGAGFARLWLHNEMLQVEGKKMSKSLGNFFTVRDLLDKGVPGEVIRFVLLGTHYSKPMDWTDQKRREAEATLRHWRAMTVGVSAGKIHEEIVSSLADDLNTSEATAVLHRLAKSRSAETLLASANLLGLLTDELGGWEHIQPLQEFTTQASLLVDELVVFRQRLRGEKRFQEADEIRKELLEVGVQILDGAAGRSVILDSDIIRNRSGVASVDEQQYWLGDRVAALADRWLRNNR